jgi:hypothetical protein
MLLKPEAFYLDFATQARHSLAWAEFSMFTKDNLDDHGRRHKNGVREVD